MDVISLVSGSKGNATLITTKKYNLLIDCGVSMKKINELLLFSEGLSLEDISFIMISHVHGDHIQGFRPIYNKEKHIKFVTTRKIKSNLEMKFEMNLDDTRFVFLDNPKKGNNLILTAFDLKHDTECVGFTIDDYDESMIFISDNGEYPKRFGEDNIFTKPYTYYVIESNYSTLEQYFTTKREAPLKRRVLSSLGHSSNLVAIEKFVNMLNASNNEICKGVMFNHLSEDTNNEELAVKTHLSYLEVWGKLKLTQNVLFSYAKQNKIIRIDGGKTHKQIRGVR